MAWITGRWDGVRVGFGHRLRRPKTGSQSDPGLVCRLLGWLLRRQVSVSVPLWHSGRAGLGRCLWVGPGNRFGICALRLPGTGASTIENTFCLRPEGVSAPALVMNQALTNP